MPAGVHVTKLPKAKFSIRVRVAKPSNALDDCAVRAQSVESFKSRLNKCDLKKFLNYDFSK